MSSLPSNLTNSIKFLPGTTIFIFELTSLSNFNIFLASLYESVALHSKESPSILKLTPVSIGLLSYVLTAKQV